MIELKNISWKTPEGKEVLKKLNLQIQNNRFVAISGPNGSGKTTLAKILMGIEQPDAGHIYMDGEEITDWDVAKRAKHGISFGFQQPVSFKGITVRRLLNLASSQEMSEKQLCNLLQKVGLCAKSYLDRDIDSTLSGGEMKRIEIASVLARNTPIIIFDEPEAGIDLWSFENLIDVFEKIRHDHTVIVISHQERILSVADEIVMVVNGAVADHGPGSVMMSKMKGNKCPMGQCFGYKEESHE